MPDRCSSNVMRCSDVLISTRAIKSSKKDYFLSKQLCVVFSASSTLYFFLAHFDGTRIFAFVSNQLKTQRSNCLTCNSFDLSYGLHMCQY